jgi:cytidylate kinase
MILGRAAVIVLRKWSEVLRVRLHGPVDARAARAATLGRISLEKARHALRRVDRAHAEYASRSYGVDIEEIPRCTA